ncbi:small GTP-binding protein [Histomonas meleagridis]|uniref:small GTP-binding protein n=1 Tax=Histomonas meleagridis TaxID=135588 RepID=UPI00355A3A5D|nr:small GTP-binding protein [Histomonas meleagridis]KAH0796918.1 small GTP-binding protein [Histomonas meleagridis]
MAQSQSLKTIFLGDSGVGKTSIINTKCCDRFDSELPPTIGSSVFSTIVKVNGTEVELKLWDTAGQEQYNSLIPMFSRNANVCILVADITSQKSIDNLDKWVTILHDSGENPPIILVFNKIDKLSPTDNTIQKMSEKFSDEYNGLVFVSALTGEGIKQIFKKAATEGLKVLEGTTGDRKNNLQANNSKCNC